MMRKQLKQKPRANRKGGRGGRGEMISHPPQIPSYGITRDVRVRFESPAAVNAAITFQNLLDVFLVATGATTGFDVFDAVRVNSIEVWASAILGTAVTATVVFEGTTAGAQGDQKIHTDTSMGIQPAHVKARPDPRTQAGQFQASSAANAFILEVPAGTVVDVSISLRQPLLATAVAVQNPLVGATTGVFYLRGLDGLAVSTTKFTPQGTQSVI
jgi:hypothetical protein